MESYDVHSQMEQHGKDQQNRAHAPVGIRRGEWGYKGVRSDLGSQSREMREGEGLG